MTSIRTATKALLLAAILAGPALAQAPADLTRDEARSLGAEAATSGDPARAREIALSLLRTDPEDRAALAVLAVAAPQLERPREGREAAERAFALAATPVQRFASARLAAAAAAVEGRPFLAELWLRRALLAAPDREARVQALADARALRDASPWRVDVELGFAPSDNVNGGADSPFNIVEGLPFVGVISVDGRALSGWTGTADVEVARRLSESARQRTELSFRLGTRAVVLSDEAKDLIEQETRPGEPEITGSDFSSSYAEVGLGHDRILGRALAGVDLAAGQSWSGGEAWLRNLRLSGSLGLTVAGSQALRFSASAEERWRLDGGAEELRLGLNAFWTRRGLGEGDRLTLGLSRTETLSDNGNAASSSWGVRASYDFGRSLGPARLGVDLGASWTDYPDYAVIFPVPGGREDRRVFGRIGASFEDWGVAGFVPVVTFEASRSDSNVSRFESDTAGLGFSLRSSF